MDRLIRKREAHERENSPLKAPMIGSFCLFLAFRPPLLHEKNSWHSLCNILSSEFILEDPTPVFKNYYLKTWL